MLTMRMMSFFLINSGNIGECDFRFLIIQDSLLDE